MFQSGGCELHVNPCTMWATQSVAHMWSQESLSGCWCPKFTSCLFVFWSQKCLLQSARSWLVTCRGTKPSAFHSPDSFVLSGFYCSLLTFNWVTLGGKCTFLINLASILIVYDYCVPVQMVMQMAMGAMQVCVSVQTLFLNLAICDAYLEWLCLDVPFSPPRSLASTSCWPFPTHFTLKAKRLLLWMFSDLRGILICGWREFLLNLISVLPSFTSPYLLSHFLN